MQKKLLSSINKPHYHINSLRFSINYNNYNIVNNMP